MALLRSFSLGHLLLGTRLASWLLPFDGTRDPELSVSKRDSTGREPCGTETREREDSNKEVREKKEGGEKTPTDSFFLLFTDFYYYFDWIKILSFVLFILF